MIISQAKVVAWTLKGLWPIYPVPLKKGEYGDQRFELEAGLSRTVDHDNQIGSLDEGVPSVGVEGCNPRGLLPNWWSWWYNPSWGTKLSSGSNQTRTYRKCRQTSSKKCRQTLSKGKLGILWSTLIVLHVFEIDCACHMILSWCERS